MQSETRIRNLPEALLTIALFAAFVDGSNDDREREEIRRQAETLGGLPGAPDLTGLYRDVLLKRVRLEDASAALTDAGERRFAYEMAVSVCDADGRTTDAERQFLANLARLLALDTTVTAALDQQAEAMAVLTETAAVPAGAATQAAVPEAELDRSILNYSILNGALELLPQSWASMAIIPLQVKMVYGIGKQHGYELDQGHIRELLATLGVGMTSQYLEQ
jgi:tellurite resistance protein